MILVSCACKGFEILTCAKLEPVKSTFATATLFEPLITSCLAVSKLVISVALVLIFVSAVETEPCKVLISLVAVLNSVSFAAL